MGIVEGGVGSGTSGFVFHKSSSSGIVPPYRAVESRVSLLLLCFLSSSLSFFGKAVGVDSFDGEAVKTFGGCEACNGARSIEVVDACCGECGYQTS